MKNRLCIGWLLISLLLIGCGAKAAPDVAPSTIVKPAVVQNPILDFHPSEQDQLIASIAEDDTELWKSTIMKIAREYDPEARSGETIFYGASNFAMWETLEADLAPYAVQNHAFGGSTDENLRHWAKYMLYPYQPRIVFFQTGSNDYVESTAETDAEKIAEAMAFKKAMFAEFHDNMSDAHFVVMSGILLPGRSEYVDMTLALNDQLKAFCEETDYMTFIDAEALTYDRDANDFVENVTDLFIEDQIHLKPEVRILWAQNWMLPIMELLEAPKN